MLSSIQLGLCQYFLRGVARRRVVVRKKRSDIVNKSSIRDASTPTLQRFVTGWINTDSSDGELTCLCEIMNPLTIPEKFSKKSPRAFCRSTLCQMLQEAKLAGADVCLRGGSSKRACTSLRSLGYKGGIQSKSK